MKHALMPVVLAASIAPGLSAQTPAPPAARTPPAEAPAVLDPTPPRRARRTALPATLQLRVVITDQIGSAEPVRKQLDLRLAESERFFLRTEAANTPLHPRFNADARAEVVGDRAALSLIVEYTANETGGGGDASSRKNSSFKYQWSELVVDLGRPTIVLQSVDPAAERRISVEVTLTATKP